MIEPDRLTEPASVEVHVDFEDFFRAEHERLFQALYLLCGDRHEADDIAQESLLRAYERWDRVVSMESPQGYVYRTAFNLHRSHLRKLSVRTRRVFAQVADDDPSGSVALGQDVHRALADLPRGQREALILVEWLGLTSDEAGRVLGIDASSVRGRLHRGRDSLRRSLEDIDE
jgi:RNA polymerase sigma-70 factor (ECF subfamily)